MSRKLYLREVHIVRQINDYLALDGWRVIKMDVVSNRAWGKGAGELGMADYLYLRYGYNMPAATFASDIAGVEHLWIEHKRSGGKPSQKQVDWIAAERARGALVLLADKDFRASLDGFVEWYVVSGLLKNNGLGTPRTLQVGGIVR